MGPSSVIEFLQAIKARADELALLGAPLKYLPDSMMATRN